MATKTCLLSNHDAIKLVGSFLDKEWKFLKEDEVTVERVQGGMCNSVYIVRRIDQPTNSSEPRQVIIRKYGGNAVPLDVDYTEMPALPREAEVAIMMEASRHGIGPKVLGIFEEGRIEEFVDSRHMKEDDLFNPKSRREIAKSLAKLHSLQMPLPRPLYKFGEVLERYVESFHKHKDKFVKNEFVLKTGIDYKTMIEYDYLKDIRILQDLLSPEKHRFVLMHWDTQYSNILIRNNPKDDENLVLFVDFENCSFNFRGKDLGLLFAQSVLDFQTEGSGIGQFPPEDVCKLFLKDYQEETEKLKYLEDFDLNGKDSIDHLMTESLVGAAVSSLFFLLYFMAYSASIRSEVIAVNVYRMYQWYQYTWEALTKRQT